jgi:hypothetical protein
MGKRKWYRKFPKASFNHNGLNPNGENCNPFSQVNEGMYIQDKLLSRFSSAEFGVKWWL